MFRAFLVISAPYKLVKPFDTNWPSQYPTHPDQILLFLFFTDENFIIGISGKYIPINFIMFL